MAGLPGRTEQHPEVCGNSWFRVIRSRRATRTSLLLPIRVSRGHLSGSGSNDDGTSLEGDTGAGPTLPDRRGKVVSSNRAVRQTG